MDKFFFLFNGKQQFVMICNLIAICFILLFITLAMKRKVLLFSHFFWTNNTRMIVGIQKLLQHCYNFVFIRKFRCLHHDLEIFFNLFRSFQQFNLFEALSNVLHGQDSCGLRPSKSFKVTYFVLDKFCCMW